MELCFRIKDYLRRQTGVTDLDKAMRQQLSPLELWLIEHQDMMEVRGKVCELHLVSQLFSDNKNMLTITFLYVPDTK